MFIDIKFFVEVWLGNTDLLSAGCDERTGQNCQVVFYVKSNQKLYRAPEKFCSSSWSREGILTKATCLAHFCFVGSFSLCWQQGFMLWDISGSIFLLENTCWIQSSFMSLSSRWSISSSTGSSYRRERCSSVHSTSSCAPGFFARLGQE